MVPRFLFGTQSSSACTGLALFFGLLLNTGGGPTCPAGVPQNGPASASNLKVLDYLHIITSHHITLSLFMDHHNFYCIHHFLKDILTFISPSLYYISDDSLVGQLTTLLYHTITSIAPNLKVVLEREAPLLTPLQSRNFFASHSA